MLKKEEIKNMKAFIIELRQRLRNCGRTNLIHLNEIDLLFIKYDINVTRLEQDGDDDKNNGRRTK